MDTVILTEEQLVFLQTLVSHDTDVLEPLLRGADLSFDTSEDDFDAVALRDLMSFTANALMGHQEVNDVHPFHGTRETVAGEFVIDLDRSLDEGPNVLTCSVVGDYPPTFMGWVFSGPDAKFVEVPQYLAGRIAACIDVALDDENACDNIGIDRNDLDALEMFVGALKRVERFSNVPPVKQQGPEWDILNPDGSVEWSGHADNEIAALDRWVRETQPGMADYTSTMQQHILEGHGPEFSLPVYRHEGIIYAVHSNYEIRVVPRKETRNVIVHLNATVTSEPGDDDNTVEQALLEAIDKIKVGGVESIDVTLVEDAPNVAA